MEPFTANGISYQWETDPDLELIKSLFIASFCACYQTLTPEILGITTTIQEWSSSNYSIETLERHLHPSSSRWITANWEQKPIGCAIFDLSHQPAEIYIAELAVDPQFQGKGIGKQLVYSIRRLIPETKKIVLITRKANQPALAFYQALGFKKCDYMHPGCDPALYEGLYLDVARPILNQ